MKKLIITMLATAASMVAFAKVNYVTVGSNEVYVVDYFDGISKSKTNSYIYVNNVFTNVTSDIYSDVDNAISQNGNFTFDHVDVFVKSRENALKCIQTLQPSAYEVSKKALLNGLQSLTHEESFQYIYSRQNFWYVLTDRQFIPHSHMDYILKHATQYAKRTLYKNGKSFVDKDGISPIKPYIDAISNAFNAPKYAGLNEALKTIDMDFGLDWSFNSKYTDKQLEDMKVDILTGDKDFGKNEQKILKTYLGVEEYNKFVKHYNEGE